MSFFIIASVGLMWLLKYSTILNFIRTPITKLHPKLDELSKCSLCLGFWTGVIVGIYGWYFCFIGMEALLLPFASSGVSWFIDSLISVIHLLKIKYEQELNLD